MLGNIISYELSSYFISPSQSITRGRVGHRLYLGHRLYFMNKDKDTTFCPTYDFTTIHDFTMTPMTRFLSIYFKYIVVYITCHLFL